MTALELHEQRRLDVCEERIRRGLATFVDVGKALGEIRDVRLYRETHETFEDYCRERWNLSRPRAYELISAAGVVSAMADTDLPTNERQARELGRVPEEDRAEVWAEVNERTVGQPTAAAIRDVREERYPSSPPVRDEPLLDGEDERRTVPAGSDSPRAQEGLPDDSPPASPVEELGAPAPSVTPSPEAVERHEADRAARVSREVSSANLAKSIWLLSGQAGMDQRVDQILASWEPSQDIYPKPTTAERIKTVADYLFELSERWPQ